MGQVSLCIGGRKGTMAVGPAGTRFERWLSVKSLVKQRKTRWTRSLGSIRKIRRRGRSWWRALTMTVVLDLCMGAGEWRPTQRRGD